MTHVVNVALGGRSYDVHIGSGLIETAGARLLPFLKRPFAALVMDESVADLHGPGLTRALKEAGIVTPEIIVPPGEQTKSFPSLEGLCDRLLDLGLERSDLIIAFGGGVVGDLAGFAAAILKRGVDFVQIPTTLLAQVDSSVGGKTAIDTKQGKNLIGAFHQPRLVLADVDVLATLPRREMICGYGEVIKYALLGDEGFFQWLEINGVGVIGGDPAPLAHAVARSVEMKSAIVSQDEREGGQRALLNLGHTFGHAVEAVTGFGEGLKHGEAVGLGCAMAFRFSTELGFCPPEVTQRVERALAAAGLPTSLGDLVAGPFSVGALMQAMAQDKKVERGSLTFILARGIGRAFVARGVDAGALEAFLHSEVVRKRFAEKSPTRAFS